CPAGSDLSHLFKGPLTSTEQFAATDAGGETVFPVGAGTGVDPPWRTGAALGPGVVVGVCGLLTVVVVLAVVTDDVLHPAANAATAATARTASAVARRRPRWRGPSGRRSRPTIGRTLSAWSCRKSAVGAVTRRLG